MSHQKGVVSVTLSALARVFGLCGKSALKKKERIDQSYMWALIEYVFRAVSSVHGSG